MMLFNKNTIVNVGKLLWYKRILKTVVDYFRIMTHVLFSTYVTSQYTSLCFGRILCDHVIT